mgnify:CR=1 FL=1
MYHYYSNRQEWLEVLDNGMELRNRMARGMLL